MANLYLLNFNNYYNRIIKKYDDLSSYSPYIIGSAIQNVNFNPNDGVDAEQIINLAAGLSIPDYVIISDTVNNVESISSRWFVIECARTRGGQYKLTLHRDVISDNYTEVINAPCFIDKATNIDDGDIAQYNLEPYSFNKIKKSETLLQDETQCAWIVGYISQKLDAAQLEGNINSFISNIDAQYTVTSSSVSDWFSTKYSSLHKTTSGNTCTVNGSPDTIRMDLKCYNTGVFNNFYFNGLNSFRTRNYGTPVIDDPFNYYCFPQVQFGSSGSWADSDRYIGQTYSAAYSKYRDIQASFESTVRSNYSLNSSASLTNIHEEDGKIIKHEYNGITKYYIISVTDRNHSAAQINVKDSLAAIKSYYTQVVSAATGTWTNVDNTVDTYKLTGHDGSYWLYISAYTDYEINLSEINVGLKYTIPADADRDHLQDSPYDMFCMPYANIGYYNGATLLRTSNKDINLACAMSMIANMSGVGAIYDVQLLPYCPLDDNYITASGNINIAGMASVGEIALQSDDTIVVGNFFFCKQSTFQFSIAHSVSITNTKRQHQTDNWRFNSPNWSASYDFDVALNKGLSYVDIDCTYKPYTPYIHVCPRFNSNGLYGYNNNDAVGLICSGDFSLPMTTDQWKTYEYNNKNFQNQFDRSIQNINTNYRLQMFERGASAIAGTAQGALTGALIGGVGGAVAGGALSAIGAVGDIHIAKAQKEEAISYATDNFNYNIDNIKSLPNTLTKVSALNANNKLFPFIEYFSCTDEEKDIFDELIKYQGGTVNRIDKIISYIDMNQKGFIKGRILRIESLEEDFHMLAAIAREVAQGVFI